MRNSSIPRAPAPSREVQRIFATMTAASALLAGCPALAAPQGGVVIAGQASISTNGGATTINQSTYQAIINWGQFSIAPNEVVNFNQPGPTAVTLNRVIGNETSVIAGALNANGQVFIVNSAGVVFTKNAQVNVGALVASTLDIANSSFKAGKYAFSGNSTAAVVNQGAIQAGPGGYVALLGANVSNQGAITATLGTVALAAGSKITLNFGGNSLLDVTTDAGALNALVANKGAIRADGGRVILTARAADALLSAQVNNSGVVQAQTLSALMGGGAPRTGSIKLVATGGKVQVSGRLDASAPNGGDGGTIETSGSKVSVAKSAVVTTKAASGSSGAWLIDPDGFTIGAGGDISGAALSSLLGDNNIAILSTSGQGTDGDVNVNDPVSWSANTTLTLGATNNIAIAAPITATGASAGLALKFGGDYVFKNASGSITLNGANASLSIDGHSYQLIDTLAQLSEISSRRRHHRFYALGQDIDASGTVFSGPVVNTLNATLAGLNHTVSNLTIIDPKARNPDALIGNTGSAAVVRDIGLLNVNVNGGTYSTEKSGNTGSAGALVNFNKGTISNAYAIGGSVIADDGVGGLVAYNLGTIANSHANVAVTGRSDTGGLVGVNYATGVIANSYTDGPVNASGVTDSSGGLTASQAIGGLVGANYGTISGSHATGDVTTVDSIDVGGLVGLNFGFGTSPATIANSYATGSIDYAFKNLNQSQFDGVGGLVGDNNGGFITNSQASGNITVNNPNGPLYAIAGIGGLVGTNESSPVDGSGGVIANSSANVNITNNGYIDSVGGLVGNVNGGSITGSSASGRVPSNANVNPRDAGGFVGAGTGATYSGDSFNATTAGQTKAVGTGDFPPGAPVPGITTVTNPSLAPLPVRTQTQLAAAQAAMVSASVNVRQSAADPPKPREIAAAGTVETAALSDPSLGDIISVPPTMSEVEGLKRRQAAEAAKRARKASLDAGRGSAEEEEAASQHHHAGGTTTPKVAGKPKPKGAGFGATIRSIEVDGKHFELQDKPGDKRPATEDHK